MKFGSKMSIAQAKTEWGADLKVVKNPTNDKLFVTANGVTKAAVSKNYDATKPDKEFVELIIEEGATTQTIWCLHNSSNANVIEVL